MSELLRKLDSKKILIDARRLGNHGIGVYTNNLIQALIEFSDFNNLKIEFGVLVLSSFLSKQNKEDYYWLDKVEIHKCKTQGYSIKEYLFFGRVIDSLNYDLVHIPHYTLPFALKTKSVVTIHDIIHISHPEKFYYPYVAKFLIGHALKKANSVISVSQSSKSEILKFFKYDSKKITVIPNLLKTKKIEIVKDSFENYFIAIISTFKKHKGLDFLLEAFKSFSENNRGFKLYLVGSGIEEAKESVIYKEFFSKNSSNIKVIGRVEEIELYSLLQNSKALCVASDIEGFCIPIIEAHSFYVPVIAKPLKVLKELEISAFDYYSKDFTIESFAEQMKKIALHKWEFTEDLKIKIDTQIESFSFNNIAELILNQYYDVLNEK